MSAHPFDTYAAVKRLSAAGFSEAQAAALVDTLSARQGELATKADIADMATKSDLKLAISELKSELIKWMLGLILPLYAILIAILLGLKF